MNKRDEIIDFFLRNQNEWFFVTDIAKKCNCTISTVRNYTSDLVDEEYTVNNCQIISRMVHEPNRKRQYCCVSVGRKP